MKLIIAIGTGSFFGGILRYLLSQFIQTKALSDFPYGTFFVNIIGCFLIGLVYGLFERGNLANEWRLFLATGLIGGFTTFSAFSVESINLLRNGQVGYASIYIVSSVFIGLIATYIGLETIKLFGH